MTVNFGDHLNWATGHSDVYLNIDFSVSLMVFLNQSIFLKAHQISPCNNGGPGLINLIAE